MSLLSKTIHSIKTSMIIYLQQLVNSNDQGFRFSWDCLIFPCFCYSPVPVSQLFQRLDLHLIGLHLNWVNTHLAKSELDKLNSCAYLLLSMTCFTVEMRLPSLFSQLCVHSSCSDSALLWINSLFWIAKLFWIANMWIFHINGLAAWLVTSQTHKTTFSSSVCLLLSVPSQQLTPEQLILVWDGCRLLKQDFCAHPWLNRHSSSPGLGDYFVLWWPVVLWLVLHSASL